MFTRTFRAAAFLRSVYGTDVFREYCRTRLIAFEQTSSESPQAAVVHRWTAALAQLSREQQAQVELELATVNELADSEGNAHLIGAAEEGQLPADSVPSGAPLALWFFLHQPVLFHEVFLHHEIQEVAAWRTAAASPGIVVSDLDNTATALSAALRAFFKLREGTAQFCTVEAHQLPEATCFVAQVADRLQYVNVFTDNGEATRQRMRPAVPILFVYCPQSGTVLLKSHLRARERLIELFRCFEETVLGSPVRYDEAALNLEILKRPFHPLPDAEDMELIRVKTLHLRYPVHAGQRQLKFETRTSDASDAIDHLLSTHMAADSLARLQVCHAELQVRLRVADGRKNYLIRLWPHGCNLNQTELGDRFRACLRRWGLSHVQ